MENTEKILLVMYYRQLVRFSGKIKKKKKRKKRKKKKEFKLLYAENVLSLPYMQTIEIWAQLFKANDVVS